MARLTDTISTAAFASRPTAANAGRLNVPSDGFSLSRDTGAAWANWGPVFPLTTPVDPGTWVNQLGATLATTKDSLYLYCAHQNASSIHARVQSIHAAPYTYTFGCLPLLGAGTNNSVGFCWRNSGSSKLVTVGLYWTAGSVIDLAIFKWTNETTFSASYLDQVHSQQYGPLVWLQLQDDSTNRIVSISADGQNFIQVHAVGRTDFITADQIGIFVDPESNTFDAAMTVVSMKQT